MAYKYLLDLYQALDRRQLEIDLEQSNLENGSEQLEFIRGRLSVINEFRSFIRDNYHSKLPRRMQ